MSSGLPVARIVKAPNSGATKQPVEVAKHDVRLVDLYNSYFETILAETDEQRRSGFRLRYEVYCVENPFEHPSQNPNGMETDAYDVRSLHSLLVRREAQDVVGTVRLILPGSSQDEVHLPIRNICRHDLIVHDNAVLPRAKTAEISRFAVSKRLRRRASDATLVGGFSPGVGDPRRHIPNTSLGLMQAIVAMAAKAGVTHLCAVMEPTLLRMLSRLGIHFIPLGPQVDYHGRRQPCFSYLDAQLARIWLERPDVWELITREGSLWPLNTDIVARLRSGGEYSAQG